jgi:hypothetical protein
MTEEKKDRIIIGSREIDPVAPSVPRGGKSIVADRMMSGIPYDELYPFVIHPLDPEVLAKRRSAKAAMLARVLDEVHQLPVTTKSPKLQNSSLSGEHYEKLPHTVSVAQKYADGTPTGVTFTYSIGPRNLSRRYRSLYNHASRRKKLYLKTLGKTHNLEECIKHARRIRF